MDPLTPLTLIYDSVTLPIMCKCMYRKSSRKIARVNTALNDLQINLTCSAAKTDKIISYSKLSKAAYSKQQQPIQSSLLAQVKRIKWTFLTKV